MANTCRRLPLATVTAIAVSIVLVTAFACPAAAQNASDKASAEVLFGKARDAMAAGNFADACPAFEASQKLDPAVGTLLNLADCYEKIGRTASAWAYFREAEGKAAAGGQAKRVAVAHGRAAALFPKLSKISIRATGSGRTRTIKRDGTLVDHALWGAGVPVDPGEHVIEVNAPGKVDAEFTTKEGWQVRFAAEGRQHWQKSVIVEVGAGTLTVDIPLTLSPPPNVAKSAVAIEAAKPAPVVKETTPTPPANEVVERKSVVISEPPPAASGESHWDRRRQRIVAVIVGAVGIAALVAGVAAGVIAESTWNTAQPHCNSAGLCDSIGYSGAESARTAGDASTSMFVVGGALVVTAGVLLLTAQRLPSAPAPTALLVPWSDGRSAGLTLGGVF